MRSAFAYLNDEEVGFALLGPRAMPEPDEADLLALALGVADDARRESCARALLSGERAARRLQAAMTHPLVDEALGLPPEARRRRVVEAFLGEAERAARFLAEGLQEGDTILGVSLVGMRVGWRLASEASDHDATARFAGALMAELMERGAWTEFAELASLGYRAADALDLSRLRSRLLAYEGAAWSRRGDYDRAARLWTERVALNRRVENPVGEADALMDLAGDALERGDLIDWEDWVLQAEAAVARSGRANLAARLWTYRAHERLKANRHEEAARHAERALLELSDISRLDVGLGVRMVAARVLGRCGHVERAARDLAGLLAAALAERRPVQAAEVLESIGDVLLLEGDSELGSRCLGSALAIHRSIGTRRAAGLTQKLGIDPAMDTDKAGSAWDLLVREALTMMDTLDLKIQLV